MPSYLHWRKKGKFSHIAQGSNLFDELHFVSAGKLRRYHNESLIRRVTDIKTIFFNIRDVIRLSRGVFQAVWLLRRLKADAVLLKGGYVCVPVAIGAKLSGVPMMTHDSDALPGLSNRISARFAKYHATAMPARYYPYPEKSVRTVGLPVEAEYREYSNQEQKNLKQKFVIPIDAEVLLITGGSNGARRLNAWCIAILPELLQMHPRLYVLHLYGKGNEGQYKDLSPVMLDRIISTGFTDELFNYSAIADVIVTRAGATTIAEFASQAKACIIVPNPDLTGGHQLKNAQVLEDLDCAVVIQERALKKSQTELIDAITSLLIDENRRQQLGQNLHSTLPEVPAAKALARLLLELAK